MFSSRFTLVGLVASVSLAVFAPLVNAHAHVTSPPIRTPGQSFLQTCGAPSFNTVSGDPTGHIEEQEPFNAGCEPTLCRGMLFADQPASNVLSVVPGEAMSMAVDCTIPHGGPANVSLVDTTVGGAGAILGSFLATFDDFCPTSGGTPANQSNIQSNLPEKNVVGGKCANPGDCVVQLFWATPDFSQNYYYCVDVKMDAAVIPTTTSTSLLTSITPVISSSVASSPSAAPIPGTITVPFILPATTPSSEPTPSGMTTIVTTASSSSVSVTPTANVVAAAGTGSAGKSTRLNICGAVSLIALSIGFVSIFSL